MRQRFRKTINTIKYRVAMTFSKKHSKKKTDASKPVSFEIWKERLKRFGIRPRNQQDYYTFFKIMVSRRAVYWSVFGLALVCLFYVMIAKPITEDGSVKVYAYDSLPLKFKEGEVSIQAKDGHIAYTGQVKEGYAEGKGTLFNRAGNTVYEGYFMKNQYCGKGNLYYPSGQLQYEGAFKANQYDGKGKLYRENGLLEYSGEFTNHMKNGSGKLYNNAGNLIFSGMFQCDEPMYAQLLHKTNTQINQLYKGESHLYTCGTDTIVSLEELDVLYVPKNTQTSLTEEGTSEMIYVLKDVFVSGATRIENGSQLKKVLGEPQFEGNSYITFYDAVALEWARENGRQTEIDVKLEATELYDECTQIDGFDSEIMVYMYVYDIGEVSYTFLSLGREDDFFMYVIAG